MLYDRESTSSIEALL